MAIAFDCFLPLSPDLPPAEQLDRLKRLLNSLVGHRQRKLSTLRSGGLDSLVAILREQREAPPEQSFALCTQVASILGALSLPTAEAVSLLLAANAHLTLIDTLTRLLNPKLPSSLPLTSQHKLAETLLRALKSLYLDLSAVIGPRLWGTDLLGGGVAPEERRDVRLAWRSEAEGHGGGKGKGREDGMEGVEAESSSRGVGDLQGMADRALEELFQTRMDDSVPSFGGLKQRPTGILAILLKLLIESSHAEEVPVADVTFQLSRSARVRMADMICSLFAGTLRTKPQRLALLSGEGDMAIATTFALLRLIVHGTGKAQESALQALSALARDPHPALIVMCRMDKVHPRPLDFIYELAHSTSPSLALAAATCSAVFSKQATYSSTSTLVQAGDLQGLVPVLLDLIEKPTALRTSATFTLAYIIADDEEVQKLTVKLKALDILRGVLEQPPRLSQPYATPASLEEHSRTAEGILLCIACICAQSETFRHQVVSAKLLPLIVLSLAHPSAGVRAAACHCIRGLARSVNVLRTSLVDTGAARPLCELLREEEDTVVKTTAVAAVSNLVLEFSPMRQVLIDQGCVPRICALVKSEDHTLRVNALWALKNASYQSTPAFKRALAKELGWDFLAEMIERSPVDITELALGILRNITITYGKDDPITGLSHSEMGEQRLMALLEGSVVSPSNAVALQGLWGLVNLAAANETAKLAIASRTQLLRSVVEHFSSTEPEIRTASVWCIINLCYTDRSAAFRRRPREILDKCKALGVDEELRRMTSDESLDVRERVRDALELFAV